MKTICVDAGNTLIKIALMEDGKLQLLAAFAVADTAELLQHVTLLPRADACILSSVSIVEQGVIDALSRKGTHFMELTAATPVPVRNLYKTPDTLGKDRLAAVVGAHALFPGRDILVLDVGTALTIDFIDREGNYRGGNISPGLEMRFRALHDYTCKLPLQTQTDDHKLIGDTTESAITAGVQNGIIFEIDAYIRYFASQYPQIITVLTGGDEHFFAQKIEQCVFSNPNLVYIGLEEIVKFNFK